ncbi:MAG TPA: asparagine--tRNA ligase [Pseudomonadales bacterium]|jgi:asparaginyl-tRNA synthetase|nr:asparagine--tRNA ligase [Gammaproteobacteria bacterium]MDP6024302.1 asparagine--tRNA ligase [Pseudomonadales bacterium]MDP7316524.1 asparagine--tRNA ligase [Pseudomonadales bacterium]MDP7576320.1 asparagine--tRNA ligase [Pseudomonadales bacterium]HJL60803.1 asparagine--tRNA ligase [Pseudomonadales bacterium]|tara:strand:- start:1248 stop:2645 length:1398 start_codon:yes stop_codon:yes gene_type:complete
MAYAVISSALKGDISVGETVTVKGWVRSKRDSKAGISFIAVHDGSCFDPIQAVVPQELDNYTSDVLKISTGAAVVITGELVKSEGKGQSLEIQATQVEVIGWVDDPETYPIAKKRHTFEYLRGVSHLRPRTNTFGAITRVRTTLANAIHNYFFERDFHWINTPIITASDCEGAGELFRVSTLDLANLPLNESGRVDHEQDFFGAESFLTVSGQLNLESYCLALTNVYTFGPTFRAENSNTSRHLAEFWMVEPEIAFADLNDNADLAENLLKNVFQSVLDQREDDMAFFEQHIDKQVITRMRTVIDNSFERMDYSEAIDILKNCKQKFEFPVAWGLDLQSEHERYLTEQHVGRPVVLMNYPIEIKAFYMRLNDDEKTVAAMDVLAPGIGEIIGGSQREERLDVLERRMTAPGLKDELWWYRDLRRYGTVPHAGFGLGFERLLNYVTGMENIRDAIPFPRTPGNAQF